MAKYDKADIERRMKGAVESLKGDLAGLRTGRANTSLLDPVVVEVYGSMMPLNQVATVSAPEPRMLSVQVWDKANVTAVEKGIAQHDPILFIESIPFTETRKYVKHVMSNWWMYQDRYNSKDQGLGMLAQNSWPIFEGYKTAVSFKK